MLQLCDNKDTFLNLKNTQTIYRAPCECIFSSHGISRADMGGAGRKRSAGMISTQSNFENQHKLATSNL